MIGKGILRKEALIRHTAFSLCDKTKFQIIVYEKCRKYQWRTNNL